MHKLRLYKAMIALGLIFVLSAVIGIVALRVDLPDSTIIPMPTPFPSHDGSGYGNG
jgi:hypothetical protein